MARKLAFDTDEDPIFYPVEEKLGEDVVQSMVVETLRPLLEDYLTTRGFEGLVGNDQMMYYAQGDPTACVSPDIYAMPRVTFEDAVRAGSWKMWDTGVPPMFALEIMSEGNRKKKDDRKSPARHDALGTNELIVFDPYADEIFRMRRRTRFRIFRRDAQGRLVLVDSTNDASVWSEALGCRLQVFGRGNSQRLRIMTGPDGETRFPTQAEAEALRADEQTRRADEQARRASDEARRANDEARRANDEARRACEAEAELERLRAQIAELQRRA